MLNKELTALQEELNYHRNSIQELEERIAEVKVYDGYAAQATEAVEEAIEQIGMGKYLWLFKEHILSMFPQQPPALHSSSSRSAYLEDRVEEDKDIVPQEVEEIKLEKSYYELTGKPDLRPTTYEDLAPNITYSSDSRAYVGFNDKHSAEEFRKSIEIPSMLDKAQIMNNHKWEVKFYCERQYLASLLNEVKESEELQEELENDWTPEQKAELDFQERLVRVAPDIFYDGTEETCYLGFRAKGRADNYGSYLSRILNIAETYVVNKEPIITTNTQYELRLNAIAEEDAKHLANFNLKKDYDHPDHREVREVWRTTRQRQVEPACKPLPRSTSVDEINLGEIVYVNSITNQYKVIDKVELNSVPHLEVICTYNSEMPELVGQTSYIREAYRVLADDVRVDSTLQKKEVVKEKPILKNNNKKLTEDDFTAPPYRKISLDEIEPCDIITTNPHSRSAYEVVKHNGDHVIALCLYNTALPGRVGEEFYFKVPYLVEKATATSAVPTVPILYEVALNKADVI